MKPQQVIRSLAVVLGLTMGNPSVGWTQQLPAASAPQPNGSDVLTEDEEHAFAARLRAAGTDEVRAQIERERDDLIRDRTNQQSSTQTIPPSREESTGNLIMPDIPSSPPPDESHPGDDPAETLPGGALLPVDPSTDLLPPDSEFDR